MAESSMTFLKSTIMLGFMLNMPQRMLLQVKKTSIYLSTKPGQTCSAESRELDPDKVNM